MRARERERQERGAGVRFYRRERRGDRPSELSRVFISLSLSLSLSFGVNEFISGVNPTNQVHQVHQVHQA